MRHHAVGARQRLAFAGVLCLLPALALASPVLRSADVLVEMASAAACEVTLAIEVDGSGVVEHRIEAVEGSHLRLLELSGARPAGGARSVGRTRALSVEPASASYTLRYATDRPASDYRCPLWIPEAVTDGLARRVRLRVRIPEGAAAVGTMPAFQWDGRDGETTLGHLPAFVRVPYSRPGEPAPWNVGLVMDIVTLLVLVGATVLFGLRRRGGRRGTKTARRG